MNLSTIIAIAECIKPFVIITRAPEIQISFSCHYSRHGLVSTGAIRGKDTEDNFEPEDNHCWKNR